MGEEEWAKQRRHVRQNMLGWAGKAWMELIVGNDIHVKQVRMAGKAWLELNGGNGGKNH